MASVARAAGVRASDDGELSGAAVRTDETENRSNWSLSCFISEARTEDPASVAAEAGEKNESIRTKERRGEERRGEERRGEERRG
jgi:hypothetical protein